MKFGLWRNIPVRTVPVLIVSTVATMQSTTGAAAAVEYVRICSAYGAGFFYIPGTDQCAFGRNLPYRVATQYGVFSTQPGVGATAYGFNAFSNGDNSVALGNHAFAGGDPFSASPGTSNAGIDGAVPNSAFFNALTTALGDHAQAGATGPGEANATAIGQGALANAANATAVGQGAAANAANATAIGQGAVAALAGSTALGQGSTVTGASSIAGNAAAGVTYNAGAVTAGSGNVVSVGGVGAERQIQNVAAGAVTQTSTDAVNGSQLYSVASTAAAGVAGVTANLNTLGTTTAASLGGGATYAAATGITGLSYTLNGSGTSYTTVVSGIQALASGAAGPVQYATPGTPSNSLNLVGTGGAVTLSNVAAGALTATSTDAVNGSQLYATNQIIAGIQNGGGIKYFHDNSTGPEAQTNGTNAVAVGSGSVANGANTTAVGTGNTVTGSNSGAFGTGNTVNGNSSYAFGDPNIVNGNNTVVTGNNNTVNGPSVAGNGDNVQVYGSNNVVASTRNASGASVLGTGNTVNAVNAVAVGNATTVTGAGAVAIGQGSSATLANAVALGQGSVTTGASSTAGNAAAGVGFNAGAVAAGSGNVVSVGAAGATRQIQNVAAGAVTATSTDAVNGSQLYAIATSASNASAAVTTLGTTTATAIGGGATYSAATGLTAPSYTLNGSGTTYGNVVAGEQALANGGAGPVQYSTPGTPSNALNLVGAGGAVTLGNVAAGTVSATSTQAINGGQLYGTAASVATALGGGAGVAANGTVTAPSYSVGGQTYNNVGSAIAALQNNTQGSLANLQNQINRNNDRAIGGIAGALSATGLRYDDRPGKISTAAAVSAYRGQAGFAGGLGYTSENGRVRVNAALTVSPTDRNPDVGAVAGVSFTLN